MNKEKSCGTICFNNDKVLMVKHNKGHWAFPKGHVEENETEFETAIRETKEETGLEVEIILPERFVITYSPKEDVIKDVVYFIAKPLSKNLKKQDEEIAQVDWVNIDEAVDYITYDDDRNIYKEISGVYKDIFLKPKK